MLFEEYKLIDISLSATSWCDLASQHQLGSIDFITLFIFNYRAGRDTEYQHSRKL